MLKFKKLTAMMLIAATITTSTISLSSVQASAAIKKFQTYGSTYAVEHNKGFADKGFKIVANAKFFEDPNDDSKTVFLSTDGSFIKSQLDMHNSDHYYWHGRMEWPSAYECSIDVKDPLNSGGETKIISSAPTNSISSSNVSTSMGYSAGGNVGVGVDGKPTGGIDGSYSFSKSISYTQPHFTTILDKNNLHQARWRVEFSSTPDGYDRNSYNCMYGNQMFMVSRYHNEGRYNLTRRDKLSTLISGGFSPNFLVALKAPKDKKETIVDIKMKREMDVYILEWTGSNWFGYNGNAGNRTGNAVQRFAIDWEKHTIRPVPNNYMG